jgi:hypothetical protein
MTCTRRPPGAGRFRQKPLIGGLNYSWCRLCEPRNCLRISYLLVAEAKEGTILPSGTAQAQEEREEDSGKRSSDALSRSGFAPTVRMLTARVVFHPETTPQKEPLKL